MAENGASRSGRRIPDAPSGSPGDTASGSRPDRPSAPPGARAASGSPGGWWARTSMAFLRLLTPGTPAGTPRATATARGSTAGSGRPATGPGPGAEVVRPVVEPHGSDRAAMIRQVDARERKMGYLGSALAAILALLAFVPYVSDPSKPISQTVSRIGKSCPAGFRYVASSRNCVGNVVYSRGHWVLELVIVLFFAVALAVATRIGRRSAVAFAALFAGLAIEATTGSIIGILFVFGGGWLLMRAWRVQRYGSPDARAARAAAAERSGGRGARGTSGDGSARRGGLFGRRSTQQEVAAAARKPPAANKRYTPRAKPKGKPSASR